MNCTTYDAENRAITFQNASYAYDGEGHRVLKLNGSGGTNTTYVYDALNREVGEYFSVAATRACMTCYLSADHLGSTRMLTGQTGSLIARHD